MIISRRQSRNPRFTIWKVAILLFGAGVWVGGMLIRNQQVTLSAIIIVAIALILSLVERRTASGDGADFDEDEV